MCACLSNTSIEGKSIFIVWASHDAIQYLLDLDCSLVWVQVIFLYPCISLKATQKGSSLIKGKRATRIADSVVTSCSKK